MYRISFSQQLMVGWSFMLWAHDLHFCLLQNHQLIIYYATCFQLWFSSSPFPIQPSIWLEFIFSLGFDLKWTFSFFKSSLLLGQMIDFEKVVFVHAFLSQYFQCLLRFVWVTLFLLASYSSHLWYPLFCLQSSFLFFTSFPQVSLFAWGVFPLLFLWKFWDLLTLSILTIPVSWPFFLWNAKTLPHLLRCQICHPSWISFCFTLLVWVLLAYFSQLLLSSNLSGHVVFSFISTSFVNHDEL